MGLKTCGLTIYNYGREDLCDIAHHAERLGFSGLWFGEHYVIPGAYDSRHPTGALGNLPENTDKADLPKLPDTPIYDPMVQAGLVAAITTTLTIGTAVCIVPLNNPLLLARQTLTLHDMSGGRLLFGAGAGWLKEEFDAVGVPFAERGSRLDEGLEILRKAWAGGHFSHSGPHHTFADVRLTADPVRIPIVCGGNTRRAVRRAARNGDAWINSGAVSIDEAVALRHAIEAERIAQGTDTRPFDVYIRPGSISLDDIGPYFDADFQNIVIRGAAAWSPRPGMSLAEKVASLEATALALGVA